MELADHAASLGHFAGLSAGSEQVTCTGPCQASVMAWVDLDLILVDTRVLAQTGTGSNMTTPTWPSLSEKQRRFVEGYMGRYKGNAKDASEAAGYRAGMGSHILHLPKIRAAIDERTQLEPDTITRIRLQNLWTDIAEGRKGFEDAELRDRLRASELLAKSTAMFVERVEVKSKIEMEVVDDGGVAIRLLELLNRVEKPLESIEVVVEEPKMLSESTQDDEPEVAPEPEDEKNA